MLRRSFLLLSMLAGCHTSAAPTDSHNETVPVPPAAVLPTPTSAFAMVELFTSEGCNSCPPADAALATLAAERRDDVYVLSFHVDYWDDLGWKDPFSSAASTARQHEYARVFGTSSVYTPQMIVNGAEQFVGSDLSRARSAIGRASPTATTLTIQIAPSDGATFTVRHHLDGAPSDAVLHVALVERSTETNVRAGENRGKRLHHVNVVRRFVTTASAGTDGMTSIDLPSGLDPANAEIIAYAQRAPDAERRAAIVAAARAAVPAR